jgi:hypothetical protein
MSGMRKALAAQPGLVDHVLPVEEIFAKLSALFIQSLLTRDSNDGNWRS